MTDTLKTMTDTLKPKIAETKLSVTELHKHYGEHEVLKGVSLSAKAGDVISIIGSSGSGKSTFLRCINFRKNPAKGRSVSIIKIFDWCAIKTDN